MSVNDGISMYSHLYVSNIYRIFYKIVFLWIYLLSTFSPTH